jgi:hypothetical protein
VPNPHPMSLGIFRSSVIGALALLVAIVAAAPAHCDPGVEYSQDGAHFHPIADLSGTSSGAAYYKYIGRSGHPGFGRERHAVTVAAYYDSADDDLSLLFICGGGHGDKADGRMTLTGLPGAAVLALSDDRGEFHFRSRAGKLVGDFGFQDSTDGFVLSNLGGATFTAKMKLRGDGSRMMRIADGDPSAGGELIPLNLRKPLWIRTTGVGSGSGGGVPTVGGGTPTPEPTGLAGAGLVAAGLLRRRRCGRAA